MLCMDRNVSIIPVDKIGTSDNNEDSEVEIFEVSLFIVKTWEIRQRIQKYNCLLIIVSIHILWTLSTSPKISLGAIEKRA